MWDPRNHRRRRSKSESPTAHPRWASKQAREAAHLRCRQQRATKQVRKAEVADHVVETSEYHFSSVQGATASVRDSPRMRAGSASRPSVAALKGHMLTFPILWKRQIGVDARYGHAAQMESRWPGLARNDSSARRNVSN